MTIETVSQLDPLLFRRVVLNANGCAVYTGAKTYEGYGVVTRRKWRRRVNLAHKYVWELLKGTVPKGQCVLHSCDTPACVNPSHLFLGSYQDNYDDMRDKGRDVKAHGSKHYKAKLSEKDVGRILKQLRKTPEKEIAVRFGVSRGTIVDIKCRRTWKHVLLVKRVRG